MMEPKGCTISLRWSARTVRWSSCCSTLPISHGYSSNLAPPPGPTGSISRRNGFAARWKPLASSRVSLPNDEAREMNYPPKQLTTTAAEGLPRRRFTVEEIEQITAAGIFLEDERFELIGGEIVPM